MSRVCVLAVTFKTNREWRSRQFTMGNAIVPSHAFKPTSLAHRIGVSLLCKTVYRGGVYFRFDRCCRIVTIVKSCRCCHAFTGINANNCQLPARTDNFAIIRGFSGSKETVLLGKLHLLKTYQYEGQFHDSGINSSSIIIECEATLLLFRALQKFDRLLTGFVFFHFT